jgi:hypothetical protein
MILRARLRRDLRAYHADLLARVLRVRCPRCNAVPSERCRGTFGPIQGTHWSRNNEAKRVGLLKGRWFDEVKYGFST